MNSAMYKQFTPAERLRLIVLAQARADVREIDRLWETCPQMDLVGRDPKFCRRIQRIRDAVSSVITYWLEVSHFVVCDRLFVTALRLESECKSQKLRIEGGNGEELAKLQADYAACAIKADASWRASSTAWKSIESAVTRFCTEVEITPEQLLAMGEWLPAAIGHASDQLHPDSHVSRADKDGTYRRLRRAWRDENSE
jgi:hypothetical protein